MKLTEAAGVGQGTFYLYFSSKKEIFDELVLDLNHRVRQAMTGPRRRATRAERELLGFKAFFRFTAEHPALYRIIRQAEFVSPQMLHRPLRRLIASGYVAALESAMAAARSRAGPRGARVGVDGDGRAARDALDRLGGRGKVPESVLDRDAS